MDEMKIGSKFVTGVISSLIKKAIRKKSGYDVDIQINEVYASMSDEKAHVHLNANLEVDKQELISILKSIGMD